MSFKNFKVPYSVDHRYTKRVAYFSMEYAIHQPLKIYSGGLGIISAPRVAAWILRDAAKELGMWDGPEGAERGLAQEIRRLTSVIVLTEKGWEPIPLHEAIAKGSLDEDEGEDIEHAISFFTLAWRYHRKEDRKLVMDGASQLWGGHLESLTYMEFCNSLSTSTGTEIIRQSPPPPPPPPNSQDLGVIQVPM